MHMCVWLRHGHGHEHILNPSLPSLLSCEVHLSAGDLLVLREDVWHRVDVWHGEARRGGAGRGETDGTEGAVHDGEVAGRPARRVHAVDVNGAGEQPERRVNGVLTVDVARVPLFDAIEGAPLVPPRRMHMPTLLRHATELTLHAAAEAPADGALAAEAATGGELVAEMAAVRKALRARDGVSACAAAEDASTLPDRGFVVVRCIVLLSHMHMSMPIHMHVSMPMHMHVAMPMRMHVPMPMRIPTPIGR